MKTPALLFLGAVSALTLAACGGGGGSGYTAMSGGASPAAAAGHGLHVATTSLGKVVVDGHGMTVYELSADSADHATCNATCQHYWPPTPSGKASALAGKVGSTALPGGGTTDTVGGSPVYTYVGDHKPGDVNGEGVQAFGGTWYAVSPSGMPVRHAGSTGSSGSSSSPAYPGKGY